METIASHSESEKAGLRAGDVILGWSRGDAHGGIESPFDLSLAEIEQAPRGTVTLEGLRGETSKSWMLGPGKWGIAAGLTGSGRPAAIYNEGRQLANAGKPADADERWKMGAAEVRGSQPSWLVPWLYLKIAGLFADAQEWKKADDAYQQAIQEAREVGPTIRAQLLRSWALTYEQRGDWRNAEQHHREAIAESQKLGADTLLTAANLFGLGYMYRVHGDFDKATEYLGQALTVRLKQAPDSLPVAMVLTNLGLIAEDRGELDKAEQYLSQALEIREKQSPESLDVAASLNNLGSVAEDRGDLAKAEGFHLSSLAIKEKLAPNSLDAAATYSSLGNVALERGDLAKAEAYMLRGLEIRKALAPGSLDVATSLGNLGTLKWRRGDFVGAEDCYREALNIEQKFAPQSPDTASTLDNLGNVALAQQDFPKARKYHYQALAIRKKLAPFSLDMGQSLDNLGMLSEEEGNLHRAASYYRQALVIQEKLAPNSLIVAVSLSNLCAVTEERHDLAGADKCYVRALAIEEKLAPDSPDTAANLARRGNVARKRGDLVLAETLFRQALSIRARVAPGSADYAESLATLGSLMRRKRQPGEAAQLFSQALDALENQIGNLGGTADTRSSFRARYARYYSEYIDLLSMQKQTDLAFHVAERLRARSLLELLGQARVDIRSGVSPALLEKEHRLRETLAAKQEVRTALLTGKHTETQLAAVEQEMEDIRTQYADIERQIRTNSPAYAGLTQPQPLNAQQTQALLDDETVLLEYALSEPRSHVWVITSGSMKGYELPPRAQIEKLARHLYTLLSTRKTSRSANGRAEQPGRERLSVAAADLSRAILGPFAPQLRGKRLLIVADGALQYIPFAVLPDPGSRDRAPLILGHEIVYSPSASVLAELRREENGRTQPTKAVAVLADPVFESDDPRVKGKASGHRVGQRTGRSQQADAPPLFVQHLTRSTADVGLLHLSRLMFSRREANAIMAMTPTGQGMEALGFDANRETAVNPNLGQYRIVHFATHALLDNEHPELSGLVLSLVDKQGKPQNGFLDLDDIYNLHLPIELAVLSACKTGLGREIRGEGLVGLTRGFMYAGATRVVASFWNADDVATKELMERFYRAMEQQGLRPVAALRQAQIQMLKQRRWSAPYYWGAFQVQGEWK
ncbi:MAG TPA: CHAT domain-containing protein [Candidatus Angelobacter sp.]